MGIRQRARRHKTKDPQRGHRINTKAQGATPNERARSPHNNDTPGRRARTHQTSLESPGEQIPHCELHSNSGPQRAVAMRGRLSGWAVDERNPPRFDGSVVDDSREVSR